jgi:hypothetical protein
MGYIFWNITQCSLMIFNRPFGRICSFHLQDRIRQVINQRKVGISMALLLPASCWLLMSLILLPWRWKLYIVPKSRLTFNRLYADISQKIEFFITTAFRTLNTTSVTLSFRGYVFCSWKLTEVQRLEFYWQNEDKWNTWNSYVLEL